MGRTIELVLAGGVAIAQLTVAGAQSDHMAVGKSASTSVRAPSDVDTLPPLPPGKSTILGGEIRDVDPVLDRFTLKVVGLKPVRILFDERTQYFRDGKRVPLRNLGPSNHASIQTTLDGPRVFAISIHVLSQSLQGEFQGQVLNYNPSTGELAVGSGPRGQAFRVAVTKDTMFAREGQSSFSSAQSGPSDLQSGTLVSVKFDPGNNDGHGVATRITIRATPGSAFVFGGNLVSIDLHAGVLMLVDPRDNSTYQIFFDSSRVPGAQSLHSGQNVRVTAEYDGTHYQAREVMVY